MPGSPVTKTAITAVSCLLLNGNSILRQDPPRHSRTSQSSHNVRANTATGNLGHSSPSMPTDKALARVLNGQSTEGPQVGFLVKGTCLGCGSAPHPWSGRLREATNHWVSSLTSMLPSPSLSHTHTKAIFFIK